MNWRQFAKLKDIPTNSGQDKLLLTNTSSHPSNFSWDVFRHNVMFQSLRQKHPFFSYYLFCVILILFYSIKVRLARKRQMFPNCSSSLFALSVLYNSSLYADKNADSEHNTERGRASNLPCVFSPRLSLAAPSPPSPDVSTKVQPPLLLHGYLKELSRISSFSLPSRTYLTLTFPWNAPRCFHKSLCRNASAREDTEPCWDLAPAFRCGVLSSHHRRELIVLHTASTAVGGKLRNRDAGIVVTVITWKTELSFAKCIVLLCKTIQPASLFPQMLNYSLHISPGFSECQARFWLVYRFLFIELFLSYF